MVGGRSDPGAILVPDGEVTTVPRPEAEVTVAFVPAKGDRPEWVVQKLTELGVDRIVPIRSRRSVVRWEGDRAAAGRRPAPPGGPGGRGPVPAAVAARGGRAVDAWRSWPHARGRPRSLAHPGGGPPSLAHPVIAVGPEGGWDDDELGLAAGTVGLGPTVLRAETAAVAAGTVLCALRSGLVRTLA